jgi:hypothetical protein
MIPAIFNLAADKANLIRASTGGAILQSAERYLSA